MAELRAGTTMFALDRRGFGASGDGPDYAIEREFEDVAAVVDAVAERVGGPVALWGHSYGASCAMGGAALTRNVNHLVLYEPSLGLAYPEGWIDTLEKTLGEGDNEAAIVLVSRLDHRRPDRGHALGPERNGRAGSPRRRPSAGGSRGGRVGVPPAPVQRDHRPDAAAVRLGEHAGDKQATARPRPRSGARIHVLDGHAHIAHRTDPALVAGIIREFVGT